MTRFSRCEWHCKNDESSGPPEILAASPVRRRAIRKGYMKLANKGSQPAPLHGAGTF
jgi:hypothetical protein